MRKSYLKGFLLTLMLGPIGLFYSNVPLALAFTILMVLTGAISIGFVVLFWPLSIVAGIFAVKEVKRRGKGETKECREETKTTRGSGSEESGEGPC